MPPTAAASATAEPEMPPKSVEAAMLTWPRPPRTWPISEPAKATMRLAMPPRTMRSPAKMKKGIAISVKIETPGGDALEDDERRQAEVDDGGEAGDAEAEGDRRADQHQER